MGRGHTDYKPRTANRAGAVNYRKETIDMADYRVIADVGMFLVNRFREGMVPGLIQSADSIGLCTSDGDGDLILSLAFYDIEILNRSFARDFTTSWPLSLKYILGVNSKASPDMKAVIDQHILGRAISILGEYPTIKKENNFLSNGDLPIDISLENIGIDERVRICEHIYGAFRTSVFYSASPVFIDSGMMKEAVRVLNG